jgi:hypothetical protein
MRYNSGMKTRRYRFLLSWLFVIALAGDALHTLHAHHDGSHCSICTLQSHSVGSDVHVDTVLASIFLPHETPLSFYSEFIPSHQPQTLFGRAPPVSIS